MATIHDISVLWGLQTPAFPGDPPLQQEMVSRLEAGDICNLTRLGMSAHYGTHIDAPLHFLPGGAAVDAYGLQRFVLPATVVDAPPGPAVLAEHLPPHMPAGEAVLLRTDNSRRGLTTSATFDAGFTVVSLAAAQRLAQSRVGLVGVDYLSAERSPDNAFPVHKALLEADVLILEMADLSRIAPGRYTLVCLPLRLAGAEASPVRAVLMEP
jgi:arylformamidase